MRTKILTLSGQMDTDIVRSYTDGLEIKEEKEVVPAWDFNPLCTSGIPVSWGFTEAQAYAVVWKTFQEIQQAAPRAAVFYGTGELA